MLSLVRKNSVSQLNKAALGRMRSFSYSLSRDQEAKPLKNLKDLPRNGE